MTRSLGWMVAIVLGLSAGAALAQEKAAAPAVNPGLWFGPENYPPEALRAAQEGRVLAIVAVDASGKPTGCVVDVSSGAPTLDKGTCDIIMAKGTFTPARDRRGRAIAGRYTLPVRWVIPRVEDLDRTIDVAAAGVTPPKFAAETRVTVKPDGTVSSCVVTPPVPAPGPEDGPCSRYAVGSKVMPAMTREGKPVGAVLVMRFEQNVTYDQ